MLKKGSEARISQISSRKYLYNNGDADL